MVALDDISLSIANKARLTLHKSSVTLILAEWQIVLSDETILRLSTEKLLADLLGLCAHKLHIQI